MFIVLQGGFVRLVTVTGKRCPCIEPSFLGEVDSQRLLPMVSSAQFLTLPLTVLTGEFYSWEPAIVLLSLSCSENAGVDLRFTKSGTNPPV